MTLGEQLEQDRLRHRAQRLEAVLKELRRLQEPPLRPWQDVPPWLSQAIADAEAERRSIEDRLH